MNRYFETKTLSRIGACVAGLIALCCVSAAGQTSGSTNPPASNEVEQGVSSAAQEGRTWFGQPFRGHWTLTGSAEVGQQYDDNVFPYLGTRLSDNVSTFSFRVSTGIRSKRLSFQAHYLPQYSLHAKYGDTNSFSQQYGQDLTYKWSERTDLAWSAGASRIESGNSSQFLLVQYSPDSAEPVFYPQALQQNTDIVSTNSLLTLHHRFTPRVTMNSGITGSFTRFKSSNSSPLIANLGNQSFQVGGNLGWDYEFVTGKKVGLTFNDSYSGFLNPSSHQNYQAALLTYSQILPGRLHFSAGAGPSFSSTQAFAGGAAATDISFAANLALSRTMRGYNLGVALNRGSQLGTVQGSLATLTSSVSASKSWRRRWTTNASFSYSRMQALVLQQRTESYSVSSSAGYRLNPQMQVQLRYSYVTQMADFLSAQNFDRNLYGVTLAYTFGEHRRQ